MSLLCFYNSAENKTLARRLLAPAVFLPVFFLIGGSTWNGCESKDEKLLYLDGTDQPGLETIVGGQPTNYEIFKGVIFISVDICGSGCTGTMIDPEVVLTAGHCVYDPGRGCNVLNNPGEIRVLGGADAVSNDTVIEYTVGSRVEKHPTWQGNTEPPDVRDLAMIKVKRKLTELEYYGVRKSSAPAEGSTGR